MPAASIGATSSLALARNTREVMTCFNPANSAQVNITGTPFE